MDYKIRELEQNEISVLNTFFYEALVRKKVISVMYLSAITKLWEQCGFAL